MNKYFLVLVLCFLFTGCKQNVGTPEDNAVPEEGENADGTEEDGTFVFGFTGIDMENPYFITLEKAIREVIEENEYQLVTKDPASDPETQAAQIQEMIDEGVDAVFLCPVDWEKITPSLEALKDAGIYIINVDTQVKEMDYVDAYVEIGVIVALLIVILLFCVLKWTKLGRNFYAVGGNSQSALMLGINVKRTKFIAHLLCGILAGVGGFVYFLHVGSGSPSHASGAEMNAIASSIIGGTMLTGGVGNIIGTFFGVLSLSTIQNIVSSAGLDQAWWTGITVAAMLCLFLVIQSVVMAARKKGNVK